MEVKDRILNLFDECKELTVKEIVEKTHASKQMVHLVLNNFIATGDIQKLGRTPKTSYRLFEKEVQPLDVEMPFLKEKENLLLNDLFLIVDELGNLLKGADAFALWCAQRHLPFRKTLEELDVILQKNKGFYDNNGNINAIDHLLHHKGFDKIWIDNLFYLDFDKIERFGKTPLGTLLYYAKQGQSTYLMNLILDEIKIRITHFINWQHADAIAFVPPTLKRELQFMKYLQNHLNLNLPVVEIKKVSGLIAVPQHAITTIEGRIKNVENTYAVTDTRSFKHVILIDDAVVTGATLNQIAGKIKLKGIAAEVTGLGIVGSLGGFEMDSD